MSCDGKGLLPCTCGAAQWNASQIVENGPGWAPCTCERKCKGCPECAPVVKKTDDERRRDADDYHERINRKRDDGPQGRFF